MGYQLTDDITVAFFKSFSQELRELISAYPSTIGIGAKQIWERFPSVRGVFVANVMRCSPSGIKRTLFSHIRECLWGDELVNDRLYFPPNSWINLQPNFQADQLDSFDCSEVDIGSFEFLKRPFHSCIELPPNSYELICVTNFSTDLALDFFSSLDLTLVPLNLLAQLHDRVDQDLDKLIAPVRLSTLEWKIEKALPDETTFAFLFDWNTPKNPDFTLAIVNRILSVSALSGAFDARIVARWRTISGVQHSLESFGDQRNPRAYLSRNGLSNDHIASSDSRYQLSMGLVAGSNSDKFASGKDDYRLRALDTVEDSGKSGVPALTILHMWMAIECMVSERSEVAQSISLALSSFWNSDARNYVFRQIKDAYKFRSQIAHGYAFPRDQIYKNIAFVGPLFERVFHSSLAFQSHEEFKLALRSHVLAGITESFDSSPYN
ncbi:MAG: HEPN domain-containing protein [Hyphomonas sp.]